MKITTGTLLLTVLSTVVVDGFVVLSPSLVRTRTTTTLYYSDDAPSDVDDEESENIMDAIPLVELDPEAIRLKQEIRDLADTTNRGFDATKEQRQSIQNLVHELIQYMPTTEPALPYYETVTSAPGGPTLQGKWTLVYTDAPDIVSLDVSKIPLAGAKLGRIGQECIPPQINNVIEWRRPDWAASLPLSGTQDSRVIQKVCTEGMATPEEPCKVNLKLVGLNLIGKSGVLEETTIEDTEDTEETTTTPSPGSKLMEAGNSLVEAIQKDGLAVGLLETSPVELKGPLSAPFGQFEILYLDDDLRIVRTTQGGFLAINVRNEEDWF